MLIWRVQRLQLHRDTQLLHIFYLFPMVFLSYVSVGSLQQYLQRGKPWLHRKFRADGAAAWLYPSISRRSGTDPCCMGLLSVFLCGKSGGRASVSPNLSKCQKLTWCQNEIFTLGAGVQTDLLCTWSEIRGNLEENSKTTWAVEVRSHH